MGCIHTSNRNKSIITIRVMELNILIYLSNLSFATFEAIRHLPRLRRYVIRSRVKGGLYFAVIEVERVNVLIKS